MFACPHYLEGEQEGFGMPQLLAILEDFHALDGLRAGKLGKCLPVGQRGEGCSGHRSEILHPKLQGHSSATVSACSWRGPEHSWH